MMMISAGCKSSASTGCVEPVRATYENLYKWPESDAEFVRSVAEGGGGGRVSRRRWAPGPEVVDSYSCRQMYLRSYTFTREEEALKPEKTIRYCLGKVREKAGLLAKRSSYQKKRRRGGRYGKKGCVVAARKLRVASCAAVCSIFRRLLSCASGGGGRKPV